MKGNTTVLLEDSTEEYLCNFEIEKTFLNINLQTLKYKIKKFNHINMNLFSEDAIKEVKSGHRQKLIIRSVTYKSLISQICKECLQICEKS